jgi:metal-responsive CopG/Arc/MetJ family transcriptional regulator
MRSISLKLSSDLLKATGRCARALGISRSEYIRRAIEKMNRESEARQGVARLTKASRRIRRQSMRVNAEFAAVEHDPNA